MCVLLPHSTASFPQGEETPYLVSSLLQQPEICLTMIKDCSTTRWRINSFCKRNEAWMDLVSWVWVWGDRGWVCCSGSVYEVDGWRTSCCREWETTFWGCSQLPTYEPGNATRFSFAYAVEKPWAGPRQVSVTRILSGWGFGARIANRIRTSGYAFFLQQCVGRMLCLMLPWVIELAGFYSFETLASITCISMKLVPG